MKPAPKKVSKSEELLALHIRSSRLPAPVRWHRFHPSRGWEFDFAWPSLMIAAEVDGGNRLAVIGKDGKPYAVGRHTQAEDYRKLNEAARLGWRVLRFTPDMVKTGEAIQALEVMLI